MELTNGLKKGKFIISSGDIFEVPLNNGNNGYFQFLYKDDEYMGGHVIRAFEYFLQRDKKIIMDSLIQFPIKFIAHTRVFEGMKEGFWNKIGNIPIESSFEPPIFRQTNDTYALVKKSFNWFIWQYSPENRKNIGELTCEYQKLPFSSVLPTSSIVEWLETGWHGYKRPE